MGSGVIDIDRGYAELKRTLRTLRNQGSYVKVGVQGDAGAQQHPDGPGASLTNVEIAVIQEFGAPSAGIPSRPFIGGTFEVNRDKYVRQLARGIAKIYENKMTVERLLGLLGVQMTKDIKQAVLSRDNHFAPNAPSTIEKKMRKSDKNRSGLIGPLESPRPLVDSARMVGSVTHEVVLAEGGSAHGYTGPAVSTSGDES